MPVNGPPPARPQKMLRGAARRPLPPTQRLARFLRTPKGTVLWVLLGLVVVAMLGTTRHTLPGVVAAVAAALAVDMTLSRWRSGRWSFPTGALLSGLFVALVLARETPLYVPLATAGLAVGVKHAVRTRWSNVFNPAVLALIVSALLFHSGQSWWGALPYDGVVGSALILAAAWYVAAKINKLPLGLAFLAATLGIFTLAAFFGGTAEVAQVFRAPDINALMFFAGFMLTDPPTSPARQSDQVWCGLVAGVIAAAVFLLTGVQWFILAGLPVANACESVRRVVAAQQRSSVAGGRGRGPVRAAVDQGR